PSARHSTQPVPLGGIRVLILPSSRISTSSVTTRVVAPPPVFLPAIPDRSAPPSWRPWPSLRRDSGRTPGGRGAAAAGPSIGPAPPRGPAGAPPHRRSVRGLLRLSRKADARPQRAVRSVGESCYRPSRLL